NDKFYRVITEPDRNLRQVVEVTLNRSDWSRSKIEPIPVSGTLPQARETGWAYDSVNQIIGGGISNVVFYTFNPLTRTWTGRIMQVQSPSGARPGELVFHCLDYDPVNSVFIFIATEASDTSASNYYSSMHTWAYSFGASASPPPTDTTPPTISSVTTSNISSTGATLTWTTNEPADSQAEYGLTTSYGSQTTLGTALVISHSVTISGLSANTTYNYRVKSRDAAGNLATSQTLTLTTSPGGPPLPSSPF